MDKRKPLMTRKTKAAMDEYAEESPKAKRAMKMEPKASLKCPKCDRMLEDNDENRAYCASKV